MKENTKKKKNNEEEDLKKTQTVSTYWPYLFQDHVERKLLLTPPYVHKLQSISNKLRSSYGAHMDSFMNYFFFLSRLSGFFLNVTLDSL